MTAGDIDLVIPHQANLRIIEAVAARVGVPAERTFVNVQRYGNMSAGTVPVALVEALEAGRVTPGAHAAAAGIRRGPDLVRAPGALGRSAPRRWASRTRTCRQPSTARWNWCRP